MLQFHTRYAISHIDSSNGLFQEKSKHGPRVQYIHGISTPLPFLGVLKKNFLGWNFLGSWFLTLQFPISKLWQTILQNYFQGWKLAFSRISKGKVTNLKFPEWGVSENYTYPPTPQLFFFFFWNSPMDRWISSKKSNYYSSMATGTTSEKISNWGGGLRTWNFLGVYWKIILRKFQRSIKKSIRKNQG